MIAENIPSRSGFSSPRAFHPWSRIYRSPSGSLKNDIFVGSYWTSNQAVSLPFCLPGQFGSNHLTIMVAALLQQKYLSATVGK